MLTKREEILVILLINCYEYLIGLFCGLGVDFLYNKYFKLKGKDGIIKSFILLFLLFMPLITLVIFGRTHIIDYIPILKDMDLKNQENFTHPPPMAFAFGFWQTQTHLKMRNDKIMRSMSTVFK
tara:strand:+ start:3840 stop:4211 length:372 start_codon:yes stop_codon:yes gene_type:complete